MFFALSNANIIITPAYQKQRVGFAVQITGDEKQESAEKLLGEVKEVDVSGSKKFPSASNIINDDNASGEITIINNSTAEQILISTTRFLTEDDKLYRLDKTVKVPAKGKITANITADLPGEEFIIGQAKLSIPGLNPAKQALIWGETQGLFKKSRTVNRLTADNVNHAKAALKQELLNQAKEELKKQMQHPENLLENALQANIIEEKTDAKINSDMPEFSVTMKIKVRGLATDQEKLHKIATANLKDIYPGDQTILKIQPETFNYQITFLDNNSENLIAQVKGEYELKVANVQIDVSQLKGMSKNEAIKNIKNLSGVNDVSIILPFWTRYLPALSEKISIKVRQ